MGVIRVQLPTRLQHIVDREIADAGEFLRDIAKVRVRLCDIGIGMVLSALG
jgi:hypothetical protein